jgi:hypothetical protein
MHSRSLRLAPSAFPKIQPRSRSTALAIRRLHDATARRRFLSAKHDENVTWRRSRDVIACARDSGRRWRTDRRGFFGQIRNPHSIILGHDAPDFLR